MFELHFDRLTLAKASRYVVLISNTIETVKALTYRNEQKYHNYGLQRLSFKKLIYPN